MITPSPPDERRRGTGIVMHRYDYVLLALAALILAAAFFASPEGPAAMNPQWAPAGIHLPGGYRSTAMLPDEDFPPY